MRAAVQQHGLHDRVDDLVVVRGKRHGDAELLPDLLGLAEDDAQHRAVDGIVLAVKHQCANSRRGLSEPVRTALALFVASGIPGEVVMDHRVEVALKVDALGQAIGCDEHGRDLPVEIREALHALFALVGGEFPGDDRDVRVASPEGVSQLGADVMGGGDVAAEHHRAEPVPHEFPDLCDERVELGIVAVTAQCIGAGDEFAKRVRVFRVFDGTGGNAFGEGQGVVGRFIHHGLAGRAVQARKLRLDGIALRGLEPGTQGERSGRGTRGGASKQCERGPPGHALLELRPALGAADHGSRVGEHIVEERAPFAGQPVGRLAAFAHGKAGVVLPLGDVAAAALHEVPREFLAQSPPRIALGRVGEFGELRLQQAQKIVEGGVVARMRRGGQEHHAAPGLALGETLEKLVALVAGIGVRLHAGMRLVDDDELRAGAQEVAAAPVGFDVVERDHGDGMDLEHRLVGPQPALESGGGAGAHDLGVDAELLREFLLPLLAEMRRTDDRKAFDLAAVEQLPGDEARLDGLANADVVGDEQPDGVQLQCH